MISGFLFQEDKRQDGTPFFIPLCGGESSFPIRKAIRRKFRIFALRLTNRQKR